MLVLLVMLVPESHFSQTETLWHLFSRRYLTVIIYYTQATVPDCCHKRTLNQLAKTAVASQELVHWKLRNRSLNYKFLTK